MSVMRENSVLRGDAPSFRRATVVIDQPMSPPVWAVLQRELLRANQAACEAFFDYYFDTRGFLRCIPRWGGDDGPDDAIENLADWPVLHALGASDTILEMAQLAWEGHVEQYTEAKTTEVPFARDGMYYKEFPTICDWLHNGESMSVFNMLGLSDPYAPNFEKRVRRFAGFYMDEDPQAPNYDPERRLIRSMYTGSRGPMLRKATALDWAGDPIEVEDRFYLLHGERNYQEMLDHFKDYNDVAGDHPLNMGATSLVLNAYLLTGEEKYRAWLVDYADAWVERTEANNGIVPSNVGLDGSIGGECGGRWYGGVYGWGFSTIDPRHGQWAHRNLTHWAYRGWGNTLMATGDLRYVDIWRTVLQNVNANAREEDGVTLFPHMYGPHTAEPAEAGWYHYTEQPFNHGALDIYYWSMQEADRARVADDPWVRFLQGEYDDYPVEAMTGDFERIRSRVESGVTRENLTLDTRLSDNPNPFNPATVATLVKLMWGGLPTGISGFPLQARLRYFDPVRRRAGLPQDVAALVTGMDADSVTVTLVNLNQTQARRVEVQGGGYGEHLIQAITIDHEEMPVNGTHFPVYLAPGCGHTLHIRMARWASQPTMIFPWD
jgi:hypothetical protein